MENITNEQELAPVSEEVTVCAEEPAAEEFTPINGAEYEELKLALSEARLKLALLMCGTAKEKLEEGAKLAEGLCAAGLQPEEAAEQIVQAYPHLKLVTREVPRFAAQTAGSGDGFSAIRSIFAKR